MKGVSFLADGALQATRVEKEDGHLHGRSGDEAEVEGLVTRFVSAVDFDVAGQKVTTTSSTTYLNGSAADLRADVKVEAEGSFDASGVLVARKIDFKHSSSIRVAANVEAIDSTAGTFTALGLTIVVDAATRREDKQGDELRFGVEDLRVGDWVEVRGYPDATTVGRVIVTRFERDEAEDEVELRGPRRRWPRRN